MSDKLPVVSGKQMAKFLESRGFYQMPRTGGSHIVMAKKGVKEFSVPDHKELKRGMTRGILGNAGISREEFVSAMRRR